MLNLLTFLQACLNATPMRHRRMSIVDTHLHGYPNGLLNYFRHLFLDRPQNILAVSTYSTFPLSHLSLSLIAEVRLRIFTYTCVTGNIYVRRTRVYALR